MSSSDELSAWRAGFGPEGGEHVGVRVAGSRATRRPGRGLDSRSPHSGEGEGGLPGAEGYGFESESELDLLEAGGAVLWGCEGRPGSPVDERGDALDFSPHLSAEPVAAVRQLADAGARSVRRHPSSSSRSCATAESGLGWRGALAPSCGEALQASAAPRRPSAPERCRAWVNPRRGPAGRVKVSEEAQGPSSDPESSDESSEIQPMRVSICPKGGGETKCSSPKAPADAARPSNVHARENFLHMTGPLLTSAPRRLTSAVEKQATGELEASSSKKKQSAIWDKAGSRPSYPGAASAAAAAAAAVGSLTRASPKKKVTQEKKSLVRASGSTLGRAFPAWGQRLRSAPLEPATFPPISGVPLLGRSTRYSLIPLGPKQSKEDSTAYRLEARKTTREPQPVAREDHEPSGDPTPQAQRGAHRPEPICLCVPPGEFSSGDSNTRALQVPGSSQRLAPSQGGIMPRGPAPSGDQEPPGHPLVAERQQPSLGAQDCPRCLVLQKEIDDLKEQLAVMQSFTDKFQTP